MATRTSARTNASTDRRQSGLVLTGVEGWRAIAALLVLFGHVWQSMGRSGTGLGPGYEIPAIGWTMGNLDIVVDLFFVLSGMLIWLPFCAAAFDDRLPISKGWVFFIRRVMRFLPLYLLIVLIEWTRHNYNVHGANWTDLFEHLLLVQSLDSGRIFYTIGAAWTLSVEWFFYLAMAFLAPSFVRWIRRGGRPGDRLARFMAGTLPILIGSIVFKWWVAHHVPVEDWAWRFGPAAKADIFVIGMYFGTAIIALRGRRLPAYVLPLCVAAAVGLYWLVKVPPTADHNLYMQVWRHTDASFAFGLILFGITTSRWQLPARIIDNKVLMPLSGLAYSIYILHEAIIEWLLQQGWFQYTPTVSGFLFDLTLTLLVALPIAWLFYTCVEMPWADTMWLMGRDGRPRELYPDLLSSSTEGAVLTRYVAHVRRVEGGHFGPSITRDRLAHRLTIAARVRTLEGEPS